MSGRAADWFRQAEADLRHARHALRDEHFEWACFAGQQTAEKAATAAWSPSCLKRCSRRSPRSTRRCSTIVLRDGAGPFLDRIPNLTRYFAGVGIGCDVIAYTESERTELAARHDAFARVVLDEGVVLARRDAGPRRW